jgi:hypothetical protein
MNDVTQAQYLMDGPVLQGEHIHGAMGENAIHSLTSHMFKPGQSIEHEPVDGAERDAQYTAQSAYSFSQPGV